MCHASFKGGKRHGGIMSDENTAGTVVENRMGTAHVHGLLIRMSLPLMVSMFVLSMYNIVDSIFVARINEDALTAVSLCFPVQQLMMAVGMGTAVGMSALLSRFLGARMYDRVTSIAQNGLFLAFCSYFIFLLMGFGARRFIALQTSEEQIITYGTQYLTVVCYCSMMVLTMINMERLVQATGKTLYIFFIQLTGAVVNIILDPILIFGLFGAPRLEVTGAAIATVTGQACGALVGVYLHITRNKEVRIFASRFKVRLRDIKEIYIIGLPSIILQAVGSVMIFGYNLILGSFSTTAIATFGAYFKLQSFVFMPVFGMNNGVVPLVAYNYGARKRDRMEQAMHISARYAIFFMTVGMILFWVFPKQILGLFDASDEMLRIGVVTLRVISLSFPGAGYAIMRGSVFQALGKSIYSMYISLVRQLFVLLPAAYLLAQLGNIDYVWWSFPIAEVVGVTMSILFSKKITREIINKIELPDS
jgi:putative MATE family efflux protein